ncbi:uncharacterized protein [Neodiprion pinetum]|uniref:uncharacterized protein n=1 Tax=Neodiprion pinetum TaxID=441929 RepID=UPI001EDE82DE|nr:uncharacterized protein LOC124221406 [Neodiprion pinetum]
MGVAMTSVVTVALILLVTTTAAEDCSTDDDCFKYQYCYETSKKCVNYTQCALFDRQEGQKLARDAKQCGPCLTGFSAEVKTDGHESDTCQKIEANQYSYNTRLVCGIIVCIVIIAIVAYVIYFVVKSKCWEKLSTCDFERTVSVIKPTAPPASSNNNDYGDMYELRIPLQANGSTNYPGAVKEHYKPVKAQAFQAPEWVNTDANYDSQESPAALTTTLEIQDEETIQSTWTPGQITSPTVTDRPFASISAEQAENTTNTALDLVTRCPIPSSSGQERRENSGPSATPPRPEHSNANPNPPSATFISANVNLNVINSGCCSNSHK